MSLKVLGHEKVLGHAAHLQIEGFGQAWIRDGFILKWKGSVWATGLALAILKTIGLSSERPYLSFFFFLLL